jgi:hypothetical protein
MAGNCRTLFGSRGGSLKCSCVVIDGADRVLRWVEPARGWFRGALTSLSRVIVEDFVTNS